MTAPNQVKGFITRRCLEELREFGAALRKGENREDIWVSVSRRWPLAEHFSETGSVFGIYGDFSDTISRALLANCDDFKFYIYIPDEELLSLENGVLRLKIEDSCTIELSNKSIPLEPDQGETIPFYATWNQFSRSGDGD